MQPRLDFEAVGLAAGYESFKLWATHPIACENNPVLCMVFGEVPLICNKFVTFLPHN